MSKHIVAEQFSDLITQLNARFLERGDVIQTVALAILTAEHVDIIGPPGGAKSELVRETVQAIKGARHFEVALSKTRPAEAVFGPLDIKRFRENGEYVLQRQGYASQVEFAFFDEIGKMSPILGHDMLALMNERIYHEVNEHGSAHRAPLSTAFAASNEMLTDDSDDAAALWDRILFRTVVDYLQDEDNFAKLLAADLPQITAQIQWEDLQRVIQEDVPAVEVSQHALDALVKLRKEFKRNNLEPSDRRWRASVKALKANAFLAGRTEVLEDDLVVLQHTLWDTLEQIDLVKRLCAGAANPYVEPLLKISDAIKEVEAGVEERSSEENSMVRTQYGAEANKKLQSARDQLDALLLESGGRPIPGFKKASDDHKRVLKRVLQVCLEQDDERAEILMQGRLGQGDGGQTS